VLPKLAAAARDASTPTAVRERRERKRAHLKLPSDSDLTSSEPSGYGRALDKGELMDKRGRDMSEAEWLDALNERRTRLCGLKITSKDGEKELQGGWSGNLSPKHQFSAWCTKIHPLESPIIHTKPLSESSCLSRKPTFARIYLPCMASKLPTSELPTTYPHYIGNITGQR